MVPEHMHSSVPKTTYHDCDYFHHGIISLTMELFAELSLLIVVATGMAVVMRLLKQPLIIGHILTGLIVGPFVLDFVHSTEMLAVMSEIGIAILLFTVGLHLDPSIIKKFGRVAVLTGLGQVVFTSLAGYFVCIMLGFTPIASFYLAIALAFSSTIIILKLITDKGDIDTLYAKIALGFLLVQDFVAVLLLLGIPLLSSGDNPLDHMARFALSALGLCLFIYISSRIFLSRLSSFIESSQEFLFMFAIAWGIGIAALFKEFGFSLESGALIAGVALASLPSRNEISSRLTPLRDFFIIIFFIFLGAQLQLNNLASQIPIALLLSVLVVIGNPLILMSILGILGYKKKTSLQTGFTVAQISEFSLILIALGVSLGHIDASILSLTTLVGLITIFTSTYLVMYSDHIYKFLNPYLDIFERKGAKEPRARKRTYEMVLFGCNRIGYDFTENLIRAEKDFLVVDYDPDTIARLQAADIDAEFGDASDIVFLETLDFKNTSLVVSTIPDATTNVLIHRTVRAQNPDAVVMVVAHRLQDALAHYDDGIDYVILPHFLGAEHAAKLAIKNDNDKDSYAALREKHIKHLQLRIEIGHESTRIK